MSKVIIRSTQIQAKGNYRKNLVLSKLLTDVVEPISSHVSKWFDNWFKTGEKIASLPRMIELTALPFRGSCLKQAVGGHASGQARALINKIEKARSAKKPKKYQIEILDKLSNGKLDISKEIKVNLNLNSHFVQIQDSKETSFDFWIRIKFPLNEYQSVEIPFSRTRHMKGLEKGGFVLKRDTIRVNRDGSFTLIYKKEVETSINHRHVGIDLGRNKAIAVSDGKRGRPLEGLLKKIDRKKRGSLAYNRAKEELKHAINLAAKYDINYESIGILHMEKLDDMKRGNKWGNRSHHWRVGLLMSRIVSQCEEQGVLVQRTNPAYTSQTCSMYGCGHKAKENRSGEKFKCVKCGHEMDADLNASINVDRMGQKRARYLEKKKLIPVLTSSKWTPMVKPISGH